MAVGIEDSQREEDLIGEENSAHDEAGGILQLDGKVPQKSVYCKNKGFS
jgi:hypothetical protein